MTTQAQFKAEYDRRFPTVDRHDHHVPLSDLFTVHMTCVGHEAYGDARWAWCATMNGVPYQMGFMDGPISAGYHDVAAVVASMLITELDHGIEMIEGILNPPI